MKEDILGQAGFDDSKPFCACYPFENFILMMLSYARTNQFQSVEEVQFVHSIVMNVLIGVLFDDEQHNSHSLLSVYLRILV
jgi:hypothetical protein